MCTQGLLNPDKLKLNNEVVYIYVKNDECTDKVPTFFQEYIFFFGNFTFREFMVLLLKFFESRIHLL